MIGIRSGNYKNYGGGEGWVGSLGLADASYYIYSRMDKQDPTV